MTMFYKRKVWAPPAWWVRMDEWQRKQAERLAIRVGRRMSKIPVRRMRMCVILYVVAMIGLNVAGLLYAYRRPPVRMLTPPWAPNRMVAPFPHWQMDPLEAYRELVGKTPVSPEDAKALDSLAKVRPGLADSLRALEGMN